MIWVESVWGEMVRGGVWESRANMYVIILMMLGRTNEKQGNENSTDKGYAPDTPCIYLANKATESLISSRRVKVSRALVKRSP